MKHKKLLGCLDAAAVAFSSENGASAASLRDLFDADYYASAYEDVRALYGNDKEALWNHFITYGLAEGRKINGDQPGLSTEELLALSMQTDAQGSTRLEGFERGYCVPEYDSAGRLVKITGYGDHGERNSEYEYDAAGNLKSRSFYRNSRFGDGSCYLREESFPDDRWNIKYDENGNYHVTYAICYNIWNDFVGEGNWSIWEYDSDGNYGVTYIVDSRRAYESRYNRFRDLLKEASYEGANYSVTYYERDDAGNCLRQTSYRNGEKYSETEYIYEYDSIKDRIRIVKMATYDGGGNISGWTDYEYDAAGNGKRITRHAADGSVEALNEWEVGEGYNTWTSYNAAGNIAIMGEYVWNDRYNGYESVETYFEYNVDGSIRDIYSESFSWSKIPWEDAFSAGLSTRHIPYIPK